MIKIKTNEEKKGISYEMLKKCKAEIGKFGFDNDSFIKFLISVGAMKVDKQTVIKYHNSELEKYREMFVKRHEVDVDDCFVFEQFRIRSSDSEGKSYLTGYFVPRSFWDKILETNLSI